MDKEFSILTAKFGESGCAKKQIAAGTYVNSEFVYAVNSCDFEGSACPRLNMPSGQGYELCRSNHAEANLADKLDAGNMKSDGIVWLVGHYWACEPCAAALKAIGMKELRIAERICQAGSR